jgi:RimJ/RimL family protein N-acetyltransferase
MIRPRAKPRLSDGVVTLRLVDERDMSAVDLGIHDPEVVRWVGPPEGSASEVLSLNQRRWEDGSPTLAICESDGACLGLVWLNLSSGDRRIGSVGYWLLPSGRGRGLATRAVRLLASWARRDLGVTRLQLTTHPDNDRSQRVAERSGFRRVAVLAADETADGRRIDPNVVFEQPTEPE